jgi:DNA-binding NarL/FixJ family response regulator
MRKPKRQSRVLIADRGGVFRLGLKKLFALEDEFRVVAQADSAAQVPQLAKKFRADLLFVQAEIAEEGPGDALGRIRQAMPKSKILVVAEALRKDEAEGYLKRGASGVVLRSAEPESFIACASKALKGEPWQPGPSEETKTGSGSTDGSRGILRPIDTLTRREKSIISCLLQGWRNREIALHLSITEQTVKNHLRTIFDKVGVSDRLELVLYAIHHGLELPPVGASPAP